MWIETVGVTNVTNNPASRPARACGLKPNIGNPLNKFVMSRPARACGLKLIQIWRMIVGIGHAPRGRVD